MLLYYITGRRNFSGIHAEQVARTIAHIRAAARAGVDMIQLREKDLTGHELEELAAAALQACRQGNPRCKLLINSRTDIALPAALDGVHLASRDVSPNDVRSVARSNVRIPARNTMTIGVSCHTVSEVLRANSGQADFLVFGPVFAKSNEKDNQAHRGAEGLAEACRNSSIPVLALGGVSPQTAQICMDAGAAGVAGIRLFQFAGRETEDQLLQQMRSRVNLLRNGA